MDTAQSRAITKTFVEVELKKGGVERTRHEVGQ